MPKEDESIDTLRENLISTNSTEAASEENSTIDEEDIESVSQETKKKSLYQRARSIGSNKSRRTNSKSIQAKASSK